MMVKPSTIWSSGLVASYLWTFLKGETVCWYYDDTVYNSLSLNLKT